MMNYAISRTQIQAILASLVEWSGVAGNLSAEIVSWDGEPDHPPDYRGCTAGYTIRPLVIQPTPGAYIPAAQRTEDYIPAVVIECKTGAESAAYDWTYAEQLLTLLREKLVQVGLHSNLFAFGERDSPYLLVWR